MVAARGGLARVADRTGPTTRPEAKLLARRPMTSARTRPAWLVCRSRLPWDVHVIQNTGWGRVLVCLSSGA
jgi:hypothetical protein